MMIKNSLPFDCWLLHAQVHLVCTCALSRNTMKLMFKIGRYPASLQDWSFNLHWVSMTQAILFMNSVPALGFCRVSTARCPMHEAMPIGLPMLPDLLCASFTNHSEVSLLCVKATGEAVNWTGWGMGCQPPAIPSMPSFLFTTKMS